jgi:uncharacterized membrane protein
MSVETESRAASFALGAGDPDRIADLASVRDDFEGPWVAWNIVRTLASTGALGCLATALFLHARRLAG